MNDTRPVSLSRRLRPGLWALRTRGDGTALAAAVRGMLDAPQPAASTSDHLAATMGWLCAAHDVGGEGGIAAFYDLRTGVWGPPYPETTGYIIPTFFDYAYVSGDPAYRARAVKMAEWLTALQLEDGAFPVGPLWPDWERRPIVFDTGQILQGLVRTFQETGGARFLEAAVRAGDWLVRVQDQDGCWRRFTSQGVAHTYNTRTAWALLQLEAAAGTGSHGAAGSRNLDWALAQQDDQGWFRGMEFGPGEDPLTHTIAYTIEGLMEGGQMLGETPWSEAAARAAKALSLCQHRLGKLPGRFTQGWTPRVSWTCPTGTAQMARIWLRLDEEVGDEASRVAGLSANRYLKDRQTRHSKRPGVAGGLPGSYPVYHEYEPFRHLNWAAKFFADSLMAELRLGLIQVNSSEAS